MAQYLGDFGILVLFIIVITALVGSITSGIGKLFSGKKRSEFVDQSNRFSAGFKAVGGNKKK